MKCSWIDDQFNIHIWNFHRCANMWLSVVEYRRYFYSMSHRWLLVRAFGWITSKTSERSHTSFVDSRKQFFFFANQRHNGIQQDQKMSTDIQKRRLLRLSLAHYRQPDCSEEDLHQFVTVEHAAQAAKIHARHGVEGYAIVRSYLFLLHLSALNLASTSPLPLSANVPKPSTQPSVAHGWSLTTTCRSSSFSGTLRP